MSSFDTSPYRVGETLYRPWRVVPFFMFELSWAAVPVAVVFEFELFRKRVLGDRFFFRREECLELVEVSDILVVFGCSFCTVWFGDIFLTEIYWTDVLNADEYLGIGFLIEFDWIRDLCGDCLEFVIDE